MSLKGLVVVTRAMCFLVEEIFKSRRPVELRLLSWTHGLKQVWAPPEMLSSILKCTAHVRFSSHFPKVFITPKMLRAGVLEIDV